MNRIKKGLLRLLTLLGRNEQYARILGVTIGKDCRILTRHFGSEPFLIEIGNRVTLSRDVSFFNHDGSTWLIRDDHGRRQRFGRIRVGNEVFIGACSIILPGVDIGDRVVIGAGTVVARSVPSGSVVAGNPAKIIGAFDELYRRRLADSAAQTDLPDPADVVAFAKAAMMQGMQPLMTEPEQTKDSQTS